jgi:hypothetical protein
VSAKFRFYPTTRDLSKQRKPPSLRQEDSSVPERLSMSDRIHFIIIKHTLHDERYSGSHRWRQMAPYLAAVGAVTTISSDSPAENGTGNAIVIRDALPPRSDGHGFIFEPSEDSHGYRLMRLLKNLIFVPDRHGRWARRAAEAALALDSAGAAKIIITSSPPHSTHVGMMKALRAERTPAVWIMDLQDPWTTAPSTYWRPKWPPHIHRREIRIERACYSFVDVIIAIGRLMANAINEQFATSVEVVCNGYTGCSKGKQNSRNLRPVDVRYMGKMIERLRDPSFLFRAARRQGFTKSQLRFCFYVNAKDYVYTLAKKAGVEGLVDFYDHVPLTHAYEIEANPGVNVVLNGTDTDSDYILTGKVFSLIRSGRPVIAITGPNSELRSVLEECGCNGVAWNDETADAALLKICKGELAPVEDTKKRFSREAAAQRVILLAKEALERPRKRLIPVKV